MADINLSVGQMLGSNMKLIDNVTGNEVSATFSNQQVVSNNHPEVANVFLNPSNPNRINVQGVSAGSGVAVISAHADYTDVGDGLPKSQDFSITKTFEVIGNPNGVTFALDF